VLAVGFGEPQVCQALTERPKDYAKSVLDPSITDLARRGILLTGFYAHTHPSQPNYLAAIGGDYFGLDHDDMVHIPQNVSTVVDLLEYKNISWAGYFEDAPGPGYMGNYSKGSSGDDSWDYVRKHNPFVSYESVIMDGDRLLQLLSFRDFQRAFAAKQVPQFVFMTPNMKNDGHNTSLVCAAASSSFLGRSDNPNTCCADICSRLVASVPSALVGRQGV